MMVDAEENKKSVRLLLDYAHIAAGPREETYGDPVPLYSAVAAAFNILKPGKALSYADVMFLLVLVKLAREGYKHQRDNLGDAAAFLSFLDAWESDCQNWTEPVILKEK